MAQEANQVAAAAEAAVNAPPNAAAAVAGNSQPPNVNVAAARRTARNPNAAVVGEFDYTNKSHLSMYEKNTESLYASDKSAKRFDLEPEKLQSFMVLFGARAKRCKWNALPNNLFHRPFFNILHFGGELLFQSGIVELVTLAVIAVVYYSLRLEA
mmetsp:Transcript_21887/g.31388  ORF Transcript_21887/g.31388 Transcript_21887/m.31388 type:complete len:155 (-) Transcript_21887:2107-2571(-)